MRRGLFWMLQLGMRLWAGIRCLETRRDERGVSGILDVDRV